MKTLLELEELIQKINNTYIKATESWQKNNSYPYNQATTYVKDVVPNFLVFMNAMNYLDFLNSIIEDELLETSALVERTRVKTLNSLLCKIYSYINVKQEKGKVPINKCLNDLYGLRIIIDTKFEYDEIKQLINNKFPTLKCTHQNKNGYNGVHVYFRINNQSYSWELQIWNKYDIVSNILSHKKHKQSYIDWEWMASLVDKWSQDAKDNKGGRKND